MLSRKRRRRVLDSSLRSVVILPLLLGFDKIHLISIGIFKMSCLDLLVVDNRAYELHSSFFHCGDYLPHRLRDLKPYGDRTFSSGGRFFRSRMQADVHSVIRLERGPIIPKSIQSFPPQNFGVKLYGAIHVRDKDGNDSHGSSLRSRLGQTLARRPSHRKCHYGINKVPF